MEKWSDDGRKKGWDEFGVNKGENREWRNDDVMGSGLDCNEDAHARIESLPFYQILYPTPS